MIISNRGTFASMSIMRACFITRNKRSVIKYQILVILTWLIVMNPVKAQDQPPELVGKDIHICDDGGEWAPFTYFMRNNGVKTKKIVGYSVDVIQQIFSKYKISYTLKLLPWKRCLSGVEKGTKYDMLLSASKNREREKKFVISESYYVTTPHYYWSKKHHPKGLDIKVPTDMNNYKIGTVRGFANSLLVKHNVDVSKMDDGASNMKALVKKLHLGRIDVFEEGWEILVGMSATGFYDFVHDKDLGRAQFPRAEKNKYYMMFTKQNSVGSALKKIFDREFTLMKASGEFNKMLNKYMQ